MGSKSVLRIIVLAGCLLAAVVARADPGRGEEQACLSLMRAFDVFNERHRDGAAGTPSPDVRRSPSERGSYLPELNRIRRAAARGNIQAEAALAEMYLQGKCGLKRDRDKALELGARAGGYFDIAMMYLNQQKPVDAYKWFTIGLMKDPWYTEKEVRLTLEEAGVKHPSKARIREYLDRVTMSKKVMRSRLQLLKTMSHMSDEQVTTAEREARVWLKTHR